MIGILKFKAMEENENRNTIGVIDMFTGKLRIEPSQENIEQDQAYAE